MFGHAGSINGKLAAAVLGIVVAGAGFAKASNVIEEDFQRQTANANPVALQGSGTAAPVGNVTTSEAEAEQRVVNIVGPKTTPPDPFGKSDNQSLRFFSSSNANPPASVFLRSSSPGLTAGAMELDVAITTKLVESPLGPWFSVMVGGTPKKTSLTGTDVDTVTRIDFRCNGRIAIRTNGEVIYIADQTFAANKVYTLRVEFDVNSDLFSVKLNNTPLTSNDGAVKSWTAISTTLPSVNAVKVFGYASGIPSTGFVPAEVFVDNIVLGDGK